MKRTISSLLLSALLLSLTLTSCSQSSSGDSGNTSDTASISETTAAETVDPLADSLPPEDFDGREFRMYARNDKNANETIYCYSEAMDGDVINDAVYKANKNVEERFNVDITMTGYEAAVNTINSPIGNSLLAGDDLFDIFSGHDRTMAQFSMAGYLTNVNLLPHIDYSKPWWPNNSLESLTVAGTMYLISNSIAYSNIRGASAVFFNKARMENYGIEEPYQTVLDGNWTLDEMISITKDVYEDVNGDTQRDKEDFYGFVGQRSAYRIAESFGLQAYHPDDELIIKLDIDRPETYEFIDKYYGLLFESKGGIMTSADADPRNMFNSDKALMTFSALADAVSTYRYSELEYGIIPMPKLNEKQENYISGANDVPFGVPVTNSDLDFTGFMIEAMSAEGHRTIQPAYFEIAMKQKFTTDSESIQMLDIISETRNIDLGYLYCGNLPICRFINSMFNPSNPTKDFASFYAKNVDAEQANIDKIIEVYTK